MGVLAGYVTSTEIRNEIRKLENTKTKLAMDIEDILRDAFREKYPKKKFDDYANEPAIVTYRDSLENKYFGMVDSRVRQLEMLMDAA